MFQDRQTENPTAFQSPSKIKQKYEEKLLLDFGSGDLDGENPHSRKGMVIKVGSKGTKGIRSKNPWGL